MMTGARAEQPQIDLEAGFVVRPSRFLIGALLVFIGIAGASVFQCAFAHFGVTHGCIAAIACITALLSAAHGWMRCQPVAIDAHADSVTTWDRMGGSRHWRIVGCAQFGARLLALSLCSGRKGTRSLLIAADSVDPETFRQLAVSSRRAARAYL
jgi:hypothetical protein